MNFEEIKERLKSEPLTIAQKSIIKSLYDYPKDMIMFDGWMTGGHGICIDKRSLRGLEKKGYIERGRMTYKTKSLLKLV